MTSTPVSSSQNRRRVVQARALGALLLALAGVAWLVYAHPGQDSREIALSPQPLDELATGAAASMDSEAFAYSPGWRVTPAGADPSQPADPWTQPSGTITFDYTGRELALNLAAGDYWGYIYVTVDGKPANLLPAIGGNINSHGLPAGYRTLYAPEQQRDDGPAPGWQRVHRARAHRAGEPDKTHSVVVEVWRAWGQTPLRGAAVDALPPAPTPAWPGILLLAISLAFSYPLLAGAAEGAAAAEAFAPLRARLRGWFLPNLPERKRAILAGAATASAAMGIAAHMWPLAAAGLAALAYLSVSWPALWSAAVVFALPFYFSFALPLPGGRAVSLMDGLLLAGIAVTAANYLLFRPTVRRAEDSGFPGRRRPRLAWLLAGLIAWALVSVSAAGHVEVALREWRTVFLSAGLFALLLGASFRTSRHVRRDLWLVMAAWIAGGTAVAAAGLVQYATGAMLISAEGVNRIRAFYGSPNNLALYLERTFLAALAGAAFFPAGKARLLSAFAAGVQGLALLLTFSKGALFIGVPTGLIVLWAGGLILLAQQGRSRRPLLWLGGAALLFAGALLPFLGTERFQRLLDFSQGTGFLRLQLWRSAWQMALDHPLLGVGPDNFLYAYRSFYLLPQAWQEPNLNHPHNWALDWWTRLGLPGLALAVAWFAAGIAGLWRRAVCTASCAEPEARHDSALFLGLLAAAVAGLAHGLIDASYALPDLMLVWVLILMAANMTPEHKLCPGAKA